MFDISKLLDSQAKTLNTINDYSIEIGVITSDSKRTTFSVGITNAELMFIHENGSPIRNIPARPVLELTIQYFNETMSKTLIDKCVEGVLNKNWTENDIRLELEKVCIRLQSYARKIIYSNDGRLAANAPSTIARKGDNHPLFDTGQLARSITCKLIKKNS